MSLFNSNQVSSTSSTRSEIMLFNYFSRLCLSNRAIHSRDDSVLQYID